MTTFFFFDSVNFARQANAQYCCQNITGDDARGFCLDAVDDLPAGSTVRLEPEPDTPIEPFCVSSKVWREWL
jgi:hypothetical protein